MKLSYKVTVEARQESGDGTSASLLEEDILERLEDAGPLKIYIETDNGDEEVYEITNWTAEPLGES